jgi:hypothetical protein
MDCTSSLRRRGEEELIRGRWSDAMGTRAVVRTVEEKRGNSIDCLT